MTKPDLADLFRETVEAVDGVCPCPRVTPWAGCAGRDWTDEQDGRQEPECACISTRPDAIKCGWLGHAAIRERLGKIAESLHDHDDPDHDRCAALRERLRRVIEGKSDER